MNKRASSIAKGMAILMMLWHHLFYSAKAIMRRSGGAGITCSLLTQHQVITTAQSLKVCVAVFVFLTGYGTFIQVSKRLNNGVSQRQGIALYALSRHVRLLLGYQFIFVIAGLYGTATGLRPLFSTYAGYGRLKGLTYLLIDFIGLAKAYGTPTYNGTWWYMSLAILLIYVVPMLTMLARRVGSFSILAVACIAPPLLGFPMSDIIPRYLPSAILGMAFAQYNLFEASQRTAANPRASRTKGCALAEAVCWGILLFLVLYLRRAVHFYWLFEALAAAIVCKIAISLDLIWGKALDLIGQHSSNIFMSHTFIVSKFFTRQLFSLRSCWAIFAALLISSLLLSAGIKYLKHLTRFDRFVAWVDNSIAARLADPA